MRLMCPAPHLTSRCFRCASDFLVVQVRERLPSSSTARFSSRPPLLLRLSVPSVKLTGAVSSFQGENLGYRSTLRGPTQDRFNPSRLAPSLQPPASAPRTT